MDTEFQKYLRSVKIQEIDENLFTSKKISRAQQERIMYKTEYLELTIEILPMLMTRFFFVEPSIFFCL